MKHHPMLCAFALILALGLQGCANTSPSHGADNTPSGVTVYGTVDLGIGKSR